MVRKRGSERIEKVMSKKRCYSNIAETSSDPPLKKERNMLNDRILSLYKEEASTAEESSESIQEEPSSREKIEEVENMPSVENSKTPRKRKNDAKKTTSGLSIINPSVTLKDVGGLREILSKIFILCSPMKKPEVYANVGAEGCTGFLLHGPPGCGKTHIVHCIAGSLGLPLVKVAATELVYGISGESESKIRDLFDEAVKTAPCFLFIDEIDVIAPKRDTTERFLEKRMVSQLLQSLDDLEEKNSRVMVIGATNRPDSIDPALRRGGRFSEFAIGIPNEEARLMILKVLTKRIKLAPNFDLGWLAHYTPGYVGADLRELIATAVKINITRMFKKFSQYSGDTERDFKSDCSMELDSYPSPEEVVSWLNNETNIPDEELEKVHIEMQDFQEALKDTVPFSKREGFAMVPNVTWDDVGALSSVKEELQEAIIWPVKYAKLFKNSKKKSSSGILLYGPKGCGKTLLAKAVANECSINFLSVKGPELLNKYLGESERAVRQCFQRANNSAPCVIFFDEIDALCSNRTSSNTNAAADRVVTTFLTEMNGIQERNNVFVIGATNRLERIDSAMLRHGRLGKTIYIGLPSPADRVDILKSLTKNKTEPEVADDVDLEVIGTDPRCEGFSGADLAHLIDTALSKALREHITSNSSGDVAVVHLRHFELAFEKVKPSVKKKENEYFERLSVHSS